MTRRNLRRRLTPEGNLVADWADDPQFWWNWLVVSASAGWGLSMLIGLMLL